MGTERASLCTSASPAILQNKSYAWNQQGKLTRNWERNIASKGVEQDDSWMKIETRSSATKIKIKNSSALSSLTIVWNGNSELFFHFKIGIDSCIQGNWFAMPILEMKRAVFCFHLKKLLKREGNAVMNLISGKEEERKASPPWSSRCSFRSHSPHQFLFLFQL